MLKHLLALCGSLVAFEGVACGLVHAAAESSTVAPPPRPYAFGYAAGRFPGMVDRSHSEISDGSGVVQGSFSYVDPSHRIRTVDYVADKAGFHPTLNFAPEDTRAVAAAKEKHEHLYQDIAAAHRAGAVHLPADTVAVQRKAQKHFDLYTQIAEEHARIAAERAAERAEKKRLGLLGEDRDEDSKQ